MSAIVTPASAPVSPAEAAAAVSAAAQLWREELRLLSLGPESLAAVTQMLELPPPQAGAVRDVAFWHARQLTVRALVARLNKGLTGLPDEVTCVKAGEKFPLKGNDANVRLFLATFVRARLSLEAAPPSTSWRTTLSGALATQTLTRTDEWMRIALNFENSFSGKNATYQAKSRDAASETRKKNAEDKRKKEQAAAEAAAAAERRYQAELAELRLQAEADRKRQREIEDARYARELEAQRQATERAERQSAMMMQLFFAQLQSGGRMPAVPLGAVDHDSLLGGRATQHFDLPGGRASQSFDFFGGGAAAAAGGWDQRSGGASAPAQAEQHYYQHYKQGQQQQEALRMQQQQQQQHGRRHDSATSQNATGQGQKKSGQNQNL